MLQYLRGMLPFVTRLWDGLAKQRQDEAAAAAAAAAAASAAAAAEAVSEEPDEDSAEDADVVPTDSAAAEAAVPQITAEDDDAAAYNPVVAPPLPTNSRFFTNMGSSNPAMTHPPLPNVTLDGLPVRDFSCGNACQCLLAHV